MDSDDRNGHLPRGLVGAVGRSGLTKYAHPEAANEGENAAAPEAASGDAAPEKGSSITDHMLQTAMEGGEVVVEHARADGPEWEDDDFWERVGVQTTDDAIRDANGQILSDRDGQMFDPLPRRVLYPLNGGVSSDEPPDGSIRARVEIELSTFHSTDQSEADLDDASDAFLEQQGDKPGLPGWGDEDFEERSAGQPGGLEKADTLSATRQLGIQGQVAAIENAESVEAKAELRLPGMTGGGELRVSIAEPPFDLYAIAGQKAQATRTALEGVWSEIERHPGVLEELSSHGDNNPPPSLFRSNAKRDAFYEALGGFEDTEVASRASRADIAKAAGVIREGVMEVVGWLGRKLDILVDSTMKAAGSMAASAATIALILHFTGHGIELNQILGSLLARFGAGGH